MLSRQQAIDAARSSAAEAMRAKGEVEPMIIGHVNDRAFVFPLGDWMDSPTSKNLFAGRTASGRMVWIQRLGCTEGEYPVGIVERRSYGGQP